MKLLRSHQLLLCSLSVAACMLAAADAAPQATKPDRGQLLKTFVAEFVAITPGQGKFPKSFHMGSASGNAAEQPKHEVTFDYSFAIAKYEVPQNLYEAVMGKNPSTWGGPRNAVEMMTWQEANDFCEQVTKLLREGALIEKDETIRIPSEAEWEYCCRAGATSTYSFGETAVRPEDAGNKASLLSEYGWHTGNAAGNDPPVGALKPNAWGLYDMHGYLWEYVADSWHPDYQGAPGSGKSWDSGDRDIQRVMRGGSWRDHFSNLRCATRWAIPDHVRSDAIGFRCVKANILK